MQPTTRGSRRNHTRVPLTTKLGELAGPMPDAIGSAVRPARRQRHRSRATAAAVLGAIAKDAVQAATTASQLITVPPAAPDDLALLFLRHDGQTRIMVAVAPETIRSERLRRGTVPRDRAAETTYEMLRAAEAQTPYGESGDADELFDDFIDEEL